MQGGLMSIWVQRMLERDHQRRIGSQKSQQPPRCSRGPVALRSVPTHTSWLRGSGRQQMGRDLLQSRIAAVTKPPRARRVTSCSEHPRCATGTLPAAAPSSACSSWCHSGGGFAPVQHLLGSTLAMGLPAPALASEQGFFWRPANPFTRD